MGQRGKEGRSRRRRRRSSSSVTVEAASAEFLLGIRSTKNLSPHTHRAYAGDLRDFCSFAAGKEIGDCDRTMIESYLRHLLEERKLMSSSVKRRLAALKLLFAWLEERGRIESNPIRQVKTKIRLPHRLPRALSQKEIRALLSQAATDLGILSKGGYRLRPSGQPVDDWEFTGFSVLLAIELLFATGVRVGELTRIEMADLDLTNGTIKIHGKGNRQRLVYLPDDSLITLVRHYLRLRERRAPPTARILIRADLRAATTSQVRAWIRNCAERAGIQRRVTPHMLRHTTATHLLEAGVDLPFVQRLLGHQSIATTQIYASVTDQHLRRMLREKHPRRSLLTS